jgi:pantothenate synthetase
LKSQAPEVGSYSNLKSELFKWAEYDTLEELDTVNRKALLSMAVFIGKTRLIDNLVLG